MSSKNMLVKESIFEHLDFWARHIDKEIERISERDICDPTTPIPKGARYLGILPVYLRKMQQLIDSYWKDYSDVEDKESFEAHLLLAQIDILESKQNAYGTLYFKSTGLSFTHSNVMFCKGWVVIIPHNDPPKGYKAPIGDSALSSISQYEKSDTPAESLVVEVIQQELDAIHIVLH